MAATNTTDETKPLIHADNTVPGHADRIAAPGPADNVAVPVPADNMQKGRGRQHYLDKLKVWLTFLVVAHHSCGAMMGQGWVYSIADYANSATPFALAFMITNQSYFMCLFFFISGYFTPTSLERKVGIYIYQFIGNRESAREYTDGVRTPRQCSLGLAACCLLCMLTRALC